jgi:hypothetical protein
MQVGRLAILTLISTALLGGQFSAASSALAQQSSVQDQPAGRIVRTTQDLLAPDDDVPHEQAPSQQLPAESAPLHGEEIESKDFATDFVLACAQRADRQVGLAELHSHSELVSTSELTLHGLHRLQI